MQVSKGNIVQQVRAGDGNMEMSLSWPNVLAKYLTAKLKSKQIRNNKKAFTYEVSLSPRPFDPLYVP